MMEVSGIVILKVNLEKCFEMTTYILRQVRLFI
jgi:hypothetical protein